jgi:hypothetical protein
VLERNQPSSPLPPDRAALDAFRLQALRYLDGLLTDEETRVLNEQLASSSDYRELFAALSIETGVLNELMLPSDLHYAGTCSPFERDVPAATVAEASLRAGALAKRAAIRGRLLALAAALLVSGMGAWIWQTNARDERHASSRNDSDAASELFSTRLEAGHTSRFKLPKVGDVILEGPAQFTMLDPMRARLDSGRINMRVTQTSGHGFVVETPYGEVTDLGTEFGLDVSDKGKAGLVVFDGEVDLRLAERQKQSNTFSRVERLVGGDGVTFGRGGQLDRIMSIVTGKSATFRSGNEPHGEDSEPLIAGISDNLRASDTKRFYEIVRGGFGEDARAFVDRAYEWNGLDANGLPSFLMGADYILPFNDDKGRQLRITLSLARPATVYVLFDDRGTPPKWLARAFVNTGFKVGMDEDQGPAGVVRPEFAVGKGPGTSVDYAFSIWKQDVNAAGRIELGSREGPRGSRSMYGIVLVPLNVPAVNAFEKK